MLNSHYKLFFTSLLLIATLHAAPGKACKSINIRAEKIICLSADLTDLNEKLATAFSAAGRKSNKNQRRQLTIDQARWLGIRNQCADADCIHTQIMNRLIQIDQYLKKL